MLPVSQFFARRQKPSTELHRRTAGASSPGGQSTTQGADVTMCAAGICQRSSVIVTVSDRLALWGHGTFDQPLLKGARLAPLWITLMSAGDLSRGIEDVARATRVALKRRGAKHSVLQMKAAVLSAWGETQNTRGTAVVLRPLGMTIRDFKRLAKSIHAGEIQRTCGKAREREPTRRPVADLRIRQQHDPSPGCM
jgi:hypothetical protein